MKITSPTQSYKVGDQVADTGTYRLYLCTQEGTERQCLLQVAAEIGNNGALDRAAFILKELERHATELEDEYAAVKKDPKMRLNYGLGFPELVDSFVSEEQGGRRINILAFRNVEDSRQVIPLSNIIERDNLRVDLRTSAWIMGKCLKLLAFAHSLGITVGRLDPTNILIVPDQHYVIIFDWSNASTHTNTIPDELGQAEIVQVAQTVIALIGGNSETGNFPEDSSTDKPNQYIEHLLNLARGGRHNATRTHEQFYQLVDELWERAFYPFTTYQL